MVIVLSSETCLIAILFFLSVSTCLSKQFAEILRVPSSNHLKKGDVPVQTVLNFFIQVNSVLANSFQNKSESELYFVSNMDKSSFLRLA